MEGQGDFRMIESKRGSRVGPWAAAVAIAASSGFWGESALAKTFFNSYVSFELPERWECDFRDTEFVCRNSNDPKSKREAVIILTAKEVGPQDNLTDYQAHLTGARMLPSRTSAVPQPSKVLRVDQKRIADQVWIDGFHLASEVPNYYTRYLATTKDKIGILVTFSAHTTVYANYVNEFLRSIESLRVTVSRSTLAGGGDGQGGPGGAGGPGFESAFPGLEEPEDPTSSGKSGGAAVGMLFAAGGMGLGALALLLLLKRRKEDKSVKKGPPGPRR